MEKKKDEGIKLSFGFLDKIFGAITELSKLQGTKTLKTSKGKEFVVSSTFDVRNLKEQERVKKKRKETIKPEAENREPLVDIFDEGKCLKTVAELPGTEKKDIKIELKKNKLIISTKDKKYHKELELPSKAQLTKKWTYKNGVLEISLKKL